MNPPNSETPRTNAATCDSRNGIRSSEGTVVLASFARQLEKELNESKQWKEEDPRMLREQVRVGDAAYQQLTSRLEASELQKLRDDECIERITKHGLELELKLQNSERANSEMRKALKAINDTKNIVHHLSGETILKVGNALNGYSSGQSYIPREVWEKMYEALNESKISILDLVKYFDTSDTTRSALEGNMVILEEALQLAQKYGLGKDKP